MPKILIFASIMEDKLENNNYTECFLIFSEVNVYFLKQKKKRRLDLLHKYPVYNACSLNYYFLQLQAVNHNPSVIQKYLKGLGVIFK